MGVILRERRTVRRPQAEAFAYSADFSNIENWDPGVVRSTRIDSGPLRVGARFDLEVKFGSRQLPMVYEITAFDPPHRVILVGRGKALEAIDEIRFSQAGDLTVIDYTADLTFHNVMRFVVPLLGPVMRKVGERALDGLVTALDGIPRQ